jgi:hypothetical protein
MREQIPPPRQISPRLISRAPRRTNSQSRMGLRVAWQQISHNLPRPPFPWTFPCKRRARIPDLWLYRDRTVALLRRYMRLSIEVGRMPSLLGREFFRTRVTRYKASTFEDSVIFVHDVEVSLEELSEFQKKLIAKVALQQYSKEEAGRLLGCGYRTVERLFPEALDRVSEILLRRGILAGLPKTKREVPKTCQGGKTGPFPAND